ncbi:hypothetical protein ACP70R_000726 [Stipagrostis hirtigluma subsp. patula]
MEFDCRAAATARADHDHRLPGPSPQELMTVDALREELVKESIRQEIILAELAERRDLEPKVGRDLWLEHDVPQHGASPVRRGGRVQLRTPLSPELSVEEAMEIPGEVLMSGRSVKDWIDEWYRPPWHDRSADDENASLHWAGLPSKTFSGMKRKRTAFEKWSCALCQVNLYSELKIKEHCSGRLHRSNIADFEFTKQATGLKRIVAAESYRCLQHNPTAWNCSICQVNCSSKLDLKSHLKGRRHRESVAALCRENEELEGKSGLLEAELNEKKASLLVDKNRRLASRWNCSMCKANCTSESDLESHLQGRRHQQKKPNY